jgi:hypothetical protein
MGDVEMIGYGISDLGYEMLDLGRV